MIKSFLDLDFYKLTMGQLVFKYFPDVKVRYRLINRSKDICLSDYISKSEIIGEFNKIKKLRITGREYLYLKSLKIFSNNYLEFLKTINLPEVKVTDGDKDFIIETSGPWSTAIYWETFVLSAITELYCSSFIKKQLKDFFLDEGKQRLNNKIKKLKNYPELKFADFGTRRRFDFQWQEDVLKTLKKELPGQLAGTSNVKLAEDLNIQPVGTFAHELYMIFYGLDKNIIESHKKVLDLWWQEYGESLSTALTDNYGSDFFFKNFSRKQAGQWRGFRHDSGDPIGFGEKAINYYLKLGIDPKKKTIVFSDSLNVDLMINIFRHFRGKIRILFGWGTGLTNDLGIKIPQIVMKPVEANGEKIAKLTDNPGKMTGEIKTINDIKKNLLSP